MPVPHPLAKVLRGWLDHVASDGFVFPNEGRDGPWTGGTVGKRPVDVLKALGERAGVPGLTFQSLRHAFATHAEYWGLTDAQIQRILRHTNPNTQHRYRHAELENMRRMVEGVDFAGPAAPTPPAGGGGGGDRPREVAARVEAVRSDPDRPAERLTPGPAPVMDPAMVEYRAVPGFPRHRVGSDRSVWTNLRARRSRAPRRRAGPVAARAGDRQAGQQRGRGQPAVRRPDPPAHGVVSHGEVFGVGDTKGRD